MPRSRSSFDLAGAIATAASLSTSVAEETPSAIYNGMALVSFGPTATGPASLPPASKSPAPQPIQAAAGAGELPLPDAPALEGARHAPRLPDLAGLASPSERCEHIVQWIVNAVGAEDVFIADASGLPIAGVGADLEGRLAASGVVASSIAHLANAIPGNTTPLFELHVGEGPFFQLVSFESGAALYLVGLTRGAPLTHREAHAVRLACCHALEIPGESAADPSGWGA